MPHSQAYAPLRQAIESLRSADGALCQVVAAINEPSLARPWHEVIHQLGVIRDELETHLPPEARSYTQPEVDSLIAIIGRHAVSAGRIAAFLDQIVTDRSITAAGRQLARDALGEARAIVAGERVLRSSADVG